MLTAVQRDYVASLVMTLSRKRGTGACCVWPAWFCSTTSRNLSSRAERRNPALLKRYRHLGSVQVRWSRHCVYGFLRRIKQLMVLGLRAYIRVSHQGWIRVSISGAIMVFADPTELSEGSEVLPPSNDTGISRAVPNPLIYFSNLIGFLSL